MFKKATFNVAALGRIHTVSAAHGSRTDSSPTKQEKLRMTANDSAILYILGEHGQTVDGSTNDIRGRAVRDKDGNGIGKVADLLVDDQERKVRFLLVEHGGILGFGRKETLIPVDAITKVTADEVFIDHSSDRVTTAPGYDPKLVADRPYHSDIYHHYGYMPYWGQGYSYPAGLNLLPM